MKKLIALSILVSILASAVFAEEEKSPISITGSADAAVTPLQIIHGGDADDTYIGAGVGRPGDPQGPKVGLSAAADYEGILGAKVDLEFFYNTTRNSGGAEFGLGDFVEVWFKPTDWFKLDVGKFNEDILRGKVGDDNWANWTVGMKNKDAIFTRFQGKAGFLAGFTPVEGLYIGILVPKFAQWFQDDAGNNTDPFLTGARTNYPGDKERAYRVYERIQVGVGYEIQGTGLVRAQFVGANPDLLEPTARPPDPSDPPNTIYPSTWFNTLENATFPFSAPRFEAAFAYTGMEGLVVDLGLKIYLPVSDWTTDSYTWIDHEYSQMEKTPSFWNPIYVSLGGQYTAGDLGIAARVDLHFLGSVTYDAIANQELEVGLPFGLNFHLWPSYNLGFATIGLDFGIAYYGKTSYTFNGTKGDEDENEGGIDVGFGLWLQKSFGNSSVRGGLAYRVGTEKDGYKHQGVLSIPIVFDYSF
jgi:hypothetical protein